MTAVDASARLPAVGGLLDLRRVLAIAGRAPGLVVAIACAWLIVVGAAVTGTNDLLHHHSLIEGGPPLVVALPLFLVGWLVMVTAMMLPVSLPAVVGRSGEEAALIGGPRARAGFLGGYALIWAGFGVATFAGDVVAHRVVDTTPWLAAHAWIIDAGLLVLAGAYQFAPAKRPEPRAVSPSRRRRSVDVYGAGGSLAWPRRPTRAGLRRELVGAHARHVRFRLRRAHPDDRPDRRDAVGDLGARCESGGHGRRRDAAHRGADGAAQPIRLNIILSAIGAKALGRPPGRAAGTSQSSPCP